MDSAPDVKTIVQDLGGQGVVSRALSRSREKPLSRAAISQWARVPEEHVETLISLPRKDGSHYTPQEIRPDLDWVMVNGRYYARSREAA